jgi:hypothetical protein
LLGYSLYLNVLRIKDLPGSRCTSSPLLPIRDIADWPNDIAIDGHGRGTRPKPDLLRWLVCGWLNPRHWPTKACHEDWFACLSHILKDGQAGGLEFGDGNLIHKQLLTLECNSNRIDGSQTMVGRQGTTART